ncbi:MAG: RluA family pseudouridine synthase [Parachlamydiaceae bacterium]|nr:RluA family pseudouridine synthase [Parachlamydiaceae bacterium]
MNKLQICKWVVNTQESGQKLIHFLILKLHNQYSAKFLKKLVDQNTCKINGKIERFASTILWEGDSVILHLSENSLNPCQFEQERVLFEDEFILIYNKPMGMTCDDEGIQFLKKYSPCLQLVHRLDKETTGALIFAKSEKIKSLFVEKFKQYHIHKRYLTIVDGRVKKSTGIVENYLGKKKEYTGQSIWGEVDKEKGLYACTHWEKIDQGDQVTLMACYPKTGRTHQIRVHMAEMKHPLIGDFQYGKNFNFVDHVTHYYLHAESLEFNHPITQKSIKIIAPIPNAFKTFLNKYFKI